MNELGVGEFGIVAFVVGLVVKELIGLVKWVLEKRVNGKGGGANSDGANGAATHSDLEDIRRLLTATDSDGLPLVYVPRSLSSAIKDLALATRELSESHREMRTDIAEMRRNLERRTG